jgi:hypothetical protein
MNDPPLSPAPLVEQALQSLRAAALPVPEVHAEPSPEVQAEPDPEAQSKPDQARVKRDSPNRKLEPAATEVEADPEPDVLPEPPRADPSSALGSAMEALRAVSVSAQTRLADPEDFPVLPVERDLPDVGPYIEHVMRQAQAAASAYREEATREAAVSATKLIDNATVLAEKVRQDADAYGEQSRARADALLAERVQRIAELTGRLSKMAQLAGDEFGDDKKMRDQMVQFVSGLADAAEAAVAEVFPDAAS